MGLEGFDAARSLGAENIEAIMAGLAEGNLHITKKEARLNESCLNNLGRDYYCYCLNHHQED